MSPLGRQLTQHSREAEARHQRLKPLAVQRGIGLIEILIAVVLIAIGFLAAARMQVEGMRFSQSAYHQSQAYFLASDIIDRMRSNVPAVAAGEYAGITTSSSASDPQCDVIVCSAKGIAIQDLYDWSASLHNLDGNSGFVPALPSSTTTAAQGQITDLGNGVFAIVMRWSEVINGADTAQELRIQFAMEAE